MRAERKLSREQARSYLVIKLPFNGFIAMTSELTSNYTQQCSRRRDVTKFDSFTGSHVVEQVCIYCNQEIAVCRLPGADQERYLDKFKSLGIDKCPSEIQKTKWMDNLVVCVDNVCRFNRHAVRL